MLIFSILKRAYQIKLAFLILFKYVVCCFPMDFSFKSNLIAFYEIYLYYPDKSNGEYPSNIDIELPIQNCISVYFVLNISRKQNLSQSQVMIE